MIKVDTKSFHLALKALIPHVSTDETRPQINGVLFEVSHSPTGAHEFRLVATEGHRLVAIRLDTAEPTLGAEKSAVVSLANAKILLAATKPSKTAPGVTDVVMGETGVSVGRGTVTQCAYVDCVLPPWRSLRPAGEPGTPTPIGLNPAYLGAIMASFTTFGADQVTWAPSTGPLDPQRITADVRYRGSIEAILMPMRL